MMKHILFAACVICLLGSATMPQSNPDNASPRSTAPSTQRTSPSTLRRFLRGCCSLPTQQQSAKDAASPTPSGQVTVPAHIPEDYIIGAEDVLEIRVWREPDLTTRAVVRPDGKIGVTLLGDVQASGLTPTQLKQSIAAKMTRFVEEPELSVVVVEIHSRLVHLIGAVGRPGAYVLSGPLTVMELLARAGGLAEYAKAEIAIVRNRPGGASERIPFNYKTYVRGRNLQQNIQLQNGDVVVVR